MNPEKLFLEAMGAGSIIFRTFDLMNRAELIIRETWGNRKAEPPGLFAILVPPPGMVEFIPELYEAHVKELCQRVKKDAPVKWATNAEVLMGLSRMSLKAPLTTQYGRIMMWAAKECGLADEAEDLQLADAEALSGLRTVLRQEGRVL